MAENNLSAIVKNGEIQPSTASQLSLSKKETERAGGSTLGKDAFLQLLVAQMKYQDPLEPTENTEYISQLATFSQLEEMQNMTAGMSLQRASGLVGKEVVCRVTNASTGAMEYAQGIVDYVVYENNKAFISIDESLYSVDDVYQIMDEQYSEAYALARKFVSALGSLPSTNELTLEYEDAIKTLSETFNSMNAYQKSFIGKEAQELLQQYVGRIKELRETANNQA